MHKQVLNYVNLCLNPLKRVKFISICVFSILALDWLKSLNPLKRVKFISIQLWHLLVSEKKTTSQSPQTGQVYFNNWWLRNIQKGDELHVSIPSNGSSLFQFLPDGKVQIHEVKVSIPSNGSSLFQWCWTVSCLLMFVTYLSQSPQTGQVYFNKNDAPQT